MAFALCTCSRPCTLQSHMFCSLNSNCHRRRACFCGWPQAWASVKWGTMLPVSSSSSGVGATGSCASDLQLICFISFLSLQTMWVSSGTINILCAYSSKMCQIVTTSFVDMMHPRPWQSCEDPMQTKPSASHAYRASVQQLCMVFCAS